MVIVVCYVMQYTFANAFVFGKRAPILTFLWHCVLTTILYKPARIYFVLIKRYNAHTLLIKIAPLIMDHLRFWGRELCCCYSGILPLIIG